MKEKLQEYALIAEIVSAFVVVASLIFVGIEIRQSAEETALNTGAIRSSAYQNTLESAGRANELLASDPALASLQFRARDEWESFTPEESARWNAFLRLIIEQADMAFYQYQIGLIDEERLSYLHRQLRIRLGSEPGKQLWGRMKGFLTVDFVAYAENLMSEIEPENDYWK